MTRTIATAAFATLMAIGFTAPSFAGESRDAYNAALDTCEQMHKDQRQDCYDKAMETYKMSVEKEQMAK